MKQQNGIRKGTTHRKFYLGAHPIIEYYINKLRIKEILADHIKQDQRLILPCEKMINLMIHNILTTPKPMYELHDWFVPIDEETVGFESGDAGKVNDDRAGKTLDLFYKGKHKQVFFRLALRAIKIFELDCSRIHQDTTTVTFSGKYETWSASELLTHGHNKDHRPDLKQLVLGTCVTADGSVPLEHQIYDGNQSDSKLHLSTHQRLSKLLKRSDFIYVADCKLATADNLRKIAACGGRFISVMPRTWKEDKQFRKLVSQGKIEWKHLMSRRNNRKPKSKLDRYYIAEGQYNTTPRYKLLWIKSFQKAEQDDETRSRHMDSALDELRDLQRRLNKYKLKTRKAIKAAALAILKTRQVSKFISFKTISLKQSKTVYIKKGRPKKDVKGKTQYSTFFSLSFSVNQEELKLAQLTDGVFPLITNVEDKTDKKILEIYKFQPFLEKRHTQLKTYQQIAPAYLKKAERVVALLHIHVIALTVATLIERQLRKKMKKENLKSIQLYPGGLPCKYPTMFDIARLFTAVERYEVQQNDEVMIFPADLTKIQKTVLKMLQVPESLYY